MLDKFGLEGFNTNKLAEISGFSTGTIYQYFANKDSILVSMVVHYNDEHVKKLMEYLESVDPRLQPVDVIINEFIILLFSEYLPESRWQRILSRIGWSMDQDPGVVAGRMAMAEGICNIIDRFVDIEEYRLKRVSREEVLMLVTSIAGCLRGVVFNNFNYDYDKLFATILKMIFAVLVNPAPVVEPDGREVEA